MSADLSTCFDVIVVGGGIIGAGVARDAALRGLSVALFEKHDFGAGTTSGSTRLIHGGLRYLEMLDFRLVRMDLRERETLLRIAPHLVKPLEFVVPFYDRSMFYRAKLRAGMFLYDALSYDRSLPGHRFLDARQTLKREPHLREEGLQGAATYFDAQVNSPERLCLENILDARAHGAHVRNYCEVTKTLGEGSEVRGVRVRNTFTGEESEVRGRVIVNAAGPWFDRVASALAPSSRPVLRTTKGIHIACKPVSENATVLFAADNRLFFVIPWLGYSWIGTTDTDFSEDPATARATEADVQYLMRSTKPFFTELRDEDIFWSNAGVRALVRTPGSESSVSRLHRISDGVAVGAPSLVSIAGGKITGYRAIAEEAVDLVCRKLGVKEACATSVTPLPGNGVTQDADLAARVLFAMREEQCMRVTDFLLRRTMLGFGPNQGMDELSTVVATMAQERKWSAATAAAEVEHYREWVRETRAFQGSSSRAPLPIKTDEKMRTTQ